MLDGLLKNSLHASVPTASDSGASLIEFLQMLNLLSAEGREGQSAETVQDGGVCRMRGVWGWGSDCLIYRFSTKPHFQSLALCSPGAFWDSRRGLACFSLRSTSAALGSGLPPPRRVHFHPSTLLSMHLGFLYFVGDFGGKERDEHAFTRVKTNIQTSFLFANI